MTRDHFIGVQTELVVCLFTWSSPLSTPSRLMRLFLWALFWHEETKSLLAAPSENSIQVYCRVGHHSIMCYHDCVKRVVFRGTTGQAVVLRHGSSIVRSLHTHDGRRRAQSDGLLQLELQKKTWYLCLYMCVIYWSKHLIKNEKTWPDL